MSLQVGIVGKPSSGKSSFYSAATLADAPVSPRPFTTIKPNVAMGYVSYPCPHVELKIKCNAANSKCEGGIRLIPITVTDVAGLVPGAHKGKGMGNQFLGDLIGASGLIHVVDMSGNTDSGGNTTSGYDPEKDIEFLEEEIDHWLAGILERNWKQIERKQDSGTELYKLVFNQYSGLGITEDAVKSIVEKGYSDPLDLARKVRKENKPIVLAGNKIDLSSSVENHKRLSKKYDIIPVSAVAELTLRKAAKNGLINYVPGYSSFEVLKKLSPEQESALDYIKTNVLEKYGSTGVQTTIDKLVFKELEYMPVYPVEDENKFADSHGAVLPHVYLLKKGSTALDLAGKVHADIAKGFIGAIDAKTKKKIGREHQLKANDIVKISSR
jgi:hypothetical protein